jgi:opine dehydrogenase
MKLRSGAFPAKRTHELVEQLNELLPAYGVTNVLDAGLHNPNALIHVPQVLLNYGAIETGLEGFSLRTDGTTPTVLRLMDIMDEERRRLCQEMGIKSILIDNMYTEMDSTPDIYRKAVECMNVPYKFLPRYLDEDIAFDLVLWWSLGKQFGVELPLVNAFITLGSLITGGNYREMGRAPDKLGIADMNAKQLLRYLEEGVE